MTNNEEIALDLLEKKGLDGLSYLKLLGLEVNEQLYDLIKKAEDLGYIPENTLQIKQITWLPFARTGWGNGYVSVPVGHKFYGKSYSELEEMYENFYLVPGGLTYSEEEESGWVLGFDSAHTFNNPVQHNKDWVKEKTVELLLSVFT